LIQAAVEGHGVALGRVALVQPMLKDGRLVAQRGVEPGISEYGYWLWSPSDTPRAAVASFRDWMVAEAKDRPKVRSRDRK
jgi:DNA-binding transcriptional LysR family regulator